MTSRDRIDWSSFVVGDLISVLFNERVGIHLAGAVQGVYVGCEVAKQERFLKLLGVNGLTTVSCSHVHDLRVVASIADNVEDA